MGMSVAGGATARSRGEGSPSRNVAAPRRARVSASAVPLLAGLTAVGLSIAIAVVVVVGFSATVNILVPIPLVTAEASWLSFLGYLLTPVLVVACYGWDTIGQRNGLRANRNFVPKPAWSRALLWLAGISVVVGAWHVLNLSVPLSEWMGLA